MPVVNVFPLILVAVATPIFGVVSVGEPWRTTVEPVPVVVAALMAVPFPAKTGLFTVVERVIAGVVVAVATVPASPFAETTETDVTVPAPATVEVRTRPVIESISIGRTVVELVLDCPPATVIRFPSLISSAIIK